VSYSYDYLQAHLAERYGQAEQQRRVSAARRRRCDRGRWGGYLERWRHGDELGGCRE
jgi:hypothetical protein